MVSFINDIENVDMYLLTEKTQLSIDRSLNEMKNDLNFLNIIEYQESCNSFFEDGNENTEVELKKKSFISNAIDRVLKILKNIKDYIKTLLESFSTSFGDKLTTAEYMQSSIAQAQFSTDIKYITDFIDKKYLEARPLVKKIAKLTNKDAESVARFCDSVTNFVHKKGKTILKVGAILTLARLLKKRMNDFLNLSDETQDILNQIKGKNLEGAHVSLIGKFANSIFGLSRLSGEVMNSLNSSIKLFNKYSK